MVSEHRRTLDALKTALQMEVDGKEFYTRASQESNNELGRNLLSTLAAEEDYHRKVFGAIYESIRDAKGWPKVEFEPDGGSNLRTVFSRYLTRTAEPSESELEAVSTARVMEAKTYDFYQSQKSQASGPSEREFYERLAAQEQEHNLVLSDYYEYLQNPAGWFVKKERPSLDG